MYLLSLDLVLLCRSRRNLSAATAAHREKDPMGLSGLDT
jgi:hypothetical protein